MQNNSQSRRTLGVRSAFQARAATLAAEQREYHLKQQAAEQQTQDRASQARPAHKGKPHAPPPAVDPKALWSQPFEARCLLVVGNADRKDKTGRRYFCQHVRGDGEVLGSLLAKFPWHDFAPTPGTLVEVAGTVSTRANGNFTAPLVAINVSRWIIK
jgi:hypothetical protein